MSLRISTKITIYMGAWTSLLTIKDSMINTEKDYYCSQLMNIQERSLREPRTFRTLDFCTVITHIGKRILGLTVSLQGLLDWLPRYRISWIDCLVTGFLELTVSLKFSDWLQCFSDWWEGLTSSLLPYTFRTEQHSSVLLLFMHQWLFRKFHYLR